MNRELTTTETFEKKKTHLAWFSLVLIVLALAYDGTPIKILGVDSQVPARPAMFLLTVLVIYSLLSFWFESQKTLRLNSHFVAGKAIDDTVAEIRERLTQSLNYLDRAKEFDFGPIPSESLGPMIENTRELAETYINYLTKLQLDRGGMTVVEGIKNHPTEESVHIDNIVEAQREFLRRLNDVPFNETDPAIAAAKGRERLQRTIDQFQADLDASIKAFTTNLTRLSRDILAEGRVQWGLLERYTPLAMGLAAAIVGLVLLLFPEAALSVRSFLVGHQRL